jgi:hypothetical protein
MPRFSYLYVQFKKYSKIQRIINLFFKIGMKIERLAGFEKRKKILM